MESAISNSRRHVLKMVGAAGGLAMAEGLRSAWAQAAKRIERLICCERQRGQARLIA